MSAAAAPATTLTTSGTVIVILADMSDWREPVSRAARLASVTGRKLKVIVADGGELLAAASLACAHLMAPGGLISAFEPRQARRLLKAQIARLRLELERLGRALGIETELVEPSAAPPGDFWAGSTALTVFGRRRRGMLMVVHAGSAATLEIAARLAAEGRQQVRLLRVIHEVGDDPADARHLARLFGPWLDAPAATVEPDAPLPLPGPDRIVTLVLDPVYVEARRLELDALLREVRRLLQG